MAVINKSDYEFMREVREIFSRCDVIITNGSKQFVGLRYTPKHNKAPVVVFKYERNFENSLKKNAESLSILCVEHKLLAGELFRVTNGKEVPCELYYSLALIYSKSEKFKKQQ